MSFGGAFFAATRVWAGQVRMRRRVGPLVCASQYSSQSLSGPQLQPEAHHISSPLDSIGGKDEELRLRLLQHALKMEARARKHARAMERLRSAADLPERVVIESARSAWEHLTPPGMSLYFRLETLRRDLRKKGRRGRTAMRNVERVMVEHLVTRESLKAARALRSCIPGTFLYKTNYSCIAEAEQDVHTAAEVNERVRAKLPELLDGVSLWFPPYRSAKLYLGSHGSGMARPSHSPARGDVGEAAASAVEDAKGDDWRLK